MIFSSIAFCQFFGAPTWPGVVLENEACERRITKDELSSLLGVMATTHITSLERQSGKTPLLAVMQGGESSLSATHFPER